MDDLSKRITRQNWFESNPKKTLAGIILTSFLLIDFSAAAFLKAIGKFKPAYVTSSIREAYYRKLHPIYHHTLAPNIHNYEAEWGNNNYIVNTNSLGFKDTAPRDITLHSTKHRVLLIGDSFTEGVGIAYPHTFAGLLQSQYADIDFLNAAVSSYAPIVYYRKIKYLLEDTKLKFDEAWVFIDLSDIEDEALGYTFDNQKNVISRNSINRVGQTTQHKNKSRPLNSNANSEFPPKPEMSFKEFFTQYTVFLAKLRVLSAYIKNVRKPWEKSLHQSRIRWTLDKQLYDEFGKQGVDLAIEHMTLLKSLLDKHKIKLTVAIYPWPDQIYNKDLHSKQVTIWQNWTQQHNVKLINLFPAFINLGDPKNVITKHFFKGDVHWNKKGHALVFDALRKIKE